MAERPNPTERTAAESDYEKKFNRIGSSESVEGVKAQEKTPDTEWKTSLEKTSADKKTKKKNKKGKFRFLGRRAGARRNGSAFLFIIGVIGLGVVYTSVFAPNIIMVNIKEMYSNDLYDGSIALASYYWKMMNYKIGRPQCNGNTENPDIKCKLSTMSRAQKKAFEKHGFTVLGTKVNQNDGRDTGQAVDYTKPESRYKVMTILPPDYKKTINAIKASGSSILNDIENGNFSNFGDRLDNNLANITESVSVKSAQDILNYMPIATGDMLWLYAQLSDTTRDQVFGVFNPMTSFFMDKRFSDVLKDRYDLTKNGIVSGKTASEVNKSFDKAMKGGNEGIDENGHPNPHGGIGLKQLGSPETLLQLQQVMASLALSSNSFVGLQCSWYAFGKNVTNLAKTAKAHTLARFAMIYLNAADQIKVGTSKPVVNYLANKLGQSFGGGYNGPNATDSSMYKHIVYHGLSNLPIPSPFGFLYYLDTFDLIGALAPSWALIMASANAQGQASGVPGQLVMPPASLGGGDRDYCLGGETEESHASYKTPKVRCQPQVTASAPPGLEGLLADALELARQTCPPPHYDDEDHQFEGEYIIQPSLKVTAGQLSPAVAGIFGANVMAWAAVESLLFGSHTTGVPASDALFAGTGQIMGDMAMSRGMEPANAVTMEIYLTKKKAFEEQQEKIARYNARQQPFNIYNQYSFLGSIVHGLSPTYNNQAPLFATLANSISLIGDSIKRLNPSADALMYLQPDFFNPARLNCPDPEYLVIGIMADVACNVRYVIGKQEMLAQPDSVLDYMTKTHSDLYQDNINELEERLATADPEVGNVNVGGIVAAINDAAKTAGFDGIDLSSLQKQITSANPSVSSGNVSAIFNLLQGTTQDGQGLVTNRIESNAANLTPTGEAENIARMLAIAVAASKQPEIDKQTGKANYGSEYQKFLDYCVNRVDPWGRSGIVVSRTKPSSKDKEARTQTAPYPAVTEGASADQDWYTGKKCLEQSEELMNFRAYTLMCSVDGTLAGTADCTDQDDSTSNSYSNDFYTSNNILFQSGS